MTGHRSRLCQFVIDVDDLDAGVDFWAVALEAAPEQLPEASSGIYRQLRLPDADIRILLQLTHDPKIKKERMHLDIESDDVEAEVSRLEGLGAKRWDHQRERGFTFGSCATPGTTSSACSRQYSRTFSDDARPGPRSNSFVKAFRAHNVPAQAGTKVLTFGDFLTHGPEYRGESCIANQYDQWL